MVRRMSRAALEVEDIEAQCSTQHSCACMAFEWDDRRNSWMARCSWRFCVVGYPAAAAVDRYKYAGNPHIFIGYLFMQQRFQERNIIPAIASIGMRDLYFDGGNVYNFSVDVRFSSAPMTSAPVKFNVYITEDSIPATGNLAQTNYLSNLPGWRRSIAKLVSQRNSSSWTLRILGNYRTYSSSAYTYHYLFSEHEFCSGSFLGCFSSESRRVPCLRWRYCSQFKTSDQRWNSSLAGFYSIIPESTKGLIELYNAMYIPTLSDFGQIQDPEFNRRTPEQWKLLFNSLGKCISLPYTSFEVARHAYFWMEHFTSHRKMFDREFINSESLDQGESVSKNILFWNNMNWKVQIFFFPLRGNQPPI